MVVLQLSQFQRILVVVDVGVHGPDLREALRLPDRRSEVLVVAPALNTRLRHWLSDEDGARRAAERRLARCLDALWTAGVRARGAIGDADPLRAIADALAGFPADEIVISTGPSTGHLPKRDLATRARERFDLPVTRHEHEPKGTGHALIRSPFGSNRGSAATSPATH